MDLDNLTPAQVINDPELFAAVFLKILDKEKNLVPFRWNNVQRTFHKSRTGRDLVLKARQLGISTYVQGEMFRRTISSTRSTLTLAHDDSTTSLFRRIADRFWEHCKFGNIQPQRDYANAQLTTYPALNSEAMIAKAGSVQVGRGATFTDIHGSEIAFWDDAKSIITGALQGGNPDCVLESTANGMQGYFFELCQEALDGDSVWTLHFFPWWSEPTYQLPIVEPLIYTEEEQLLVKKNDLKPEQIAWRRYKQKELKEKFPQEFAEDPISCFLHSGEGFFGDLTNVFTAPDGAEWQENHQYSAGLDFAQSGDWTDMVIIDRTTRQQVYYLHVHHLQWSEIRERIKTTYRLFRRKRCQNGHINPVDVIKCNECNSTKLEGVGLRYVVAEKNSVGKPNIEALRDDGVIISEFQTDNTSKREIIANLYESLHTGGLKLLNNSMIRQEFNSFVSIQTPSGLWTARAAKGAHDDAVMATAFAAYYVPPQIFLTPNE